MKEPSEMPDVSSIGKGPVGPVQRHTPHVDPSLNGTPRNDSSQPPVRDSVELSEHARLLDRLRQLPDVRAERVERIRDAIAGGEYETENRLGLAIEKLMKEIGE